MAIESPSISVVSADKNEPLSSVVEQSSFVKVDSFAISRCSSDPFKSSTIFQEIPG